MQSAAESFHLGLEHRMQEGRHVQSLLEVLVTLPTQQRREEVSDQDNPWLLSCVDIIESFER